VLFRDLVDPAPTDLEPIAFNPGNLDNIAPQCIQRFINDAIQAGAVTGGSVMVVPHMMKASDENIDWLLTYQNSANQLVANTAAVEQLTTVGEVYSARAEDQGYVYGTQSQLTAFEDPKPQPAPDPCSATQPCPTGLTCEKDGLCSAVSSCQTNADCPSGRICFEGLCSEKKAGHWTYRWGWQIAGAYIGVIGSSDNHSQMAGVNDEMPALPSMTSSPVADNEPGGYAVVLSSGAVEAKKGKRFGIFDGMRASRTYATTATRAYLDYSVASTAMGGALASTNGTETASITLCAGVPIDKIELWGAQTTNQTTLDYQLERVVNLSGQDKECFTGTVTLFNQSTVTNRYVEWLYYVRAFLKWPNSSNAGPDEAVWSSPIWVEWEQVVHPPPPPPPPPPGPCPPNCPI